MRASHAVAETGDSSSRTALALRLRSLLFVPGDSDRKINSAACCEADAIIFDLEDAVAPPLKSLARNRVRKVLDERRPNFAIVRINAFDTPWSLQDLATICPAAPDCIMLPKCMSQQDVAKLDHFLSAFEASCGLADGAISILPLVTETAVALENLRYDNVNGRLIGLGFAGEDLASDLGVAARNEHGMLNPLLVEARQAVAIAARAAAIPAIDTPYPNPRDRSGLARESGDAATLGFGGKMCIHPDQIADVHAALQPGEQQLAWARRVVEALNGASDTGVALLDGKMLDRAHLRLAERYLSHEIENGNAQ